MFLSLALVNVSSKLVTALVTSSGHFTAAVHQPTLLGFLHRRKVPSLLLSLAEVAQPVIRCEHEGDRDRELLGGGRGGSSGGSPCAVSGCTG